MKKSCLPGTLEEQLQQRYEKTHFMLLERVVMW
jgi:hypothetical protein